MNHNPNKIFYNLKYEKLKNSNEPFTIIIPFRDNEQQNRRKQLNKIIPHLEEKLIKYTNKFNIIVIEQSDDNRKFNRGALLNIGHKIVENESKYIIFHDVDLLPDDTIIKYYLQYPYNPIHIGNNIKKYNFPLFLGAILSISIDTNNKINGFPNDFWGWGGEDDSYLRRLIVNNIKVARPSKGSFDELYHITTKQEKIPKPIKRYKINQTNYNWTFNGLNNIKYTIINNNKLSEHATKYTTYIDNTVFEIIPKIDSFNTIDECNKNRRTNIMNYINNHLVSKQEILDFVDILKEKYPIKSNYIVNTNNIFNENKKINDYIEKLKNFKIYKFHDDKEKAFMNGFKYLYYHIYKSTYVRIQDNKLICFKTFINFYPHNEWGQNLIFEEKYLKQKGINPEPEHWIANNCLIDNTLPIGIYPSRLMEFAHLLEETLKTNKVKDCEFFYNKRDFPIIRKDLKHPAEMLFDKDFINVDYSDKYDFMLPILGCSSSDKHVDVMIPTEDDIYMVFQRLYPTRCENSYLNIEKDNIKWNDKIPTAIFRGKATGCGVTINTNQRLKLSYLSDKWNNDDNYNENNKIDGIKFLDAGITGWNKRDKVYYREIKKIKLDQIPFNKAERISREEQYKYKYLISVDGHVRPFRVPFELGTNSLVLLVDSEFDYKCWWSNLIEPYIHYIPIKADLSDLDEKIKWCKTNDNECKKISENATEWYNIYMNKKGLTDYVSKILNEIA